MAKGKSSLIDGLGNRTDEALDEHAGEGITRSERGGRGYRLIFLLAGHKVDFIAPCGANKSTF